MIKPEVLIEHVNQSIQKALNHQSWIHGEALDVKGFTSGVMIRMIANIVHLPVENPAYLEVGLWAGKSFCACMNNSPTLNLYGVEDFSQPFNEPNIRQELESNIERFKGEARSVTVINSDCFNLDLKQIKYPVQAYLYDGCHDFESQQKALPYYIDAMDDVFCFLCDDNDWVPVSTGNRAGIDSLVKAGKIKVEREWILTDGKPDGETWRNGMFLAVISKIK